MAIAGKIGREIRLAIRDGSRYTIALGAGLAERPDQLPGPVEACVFSISRIAKSVAL
jgi:hypothetical protein